MKVRSSQNWQCGNKFLATCDDPELQHQLKFAIRSKSTQTVSGNAQKTMGGYRNQEKSAEPKSLLDPHCTGVSQFLALNKNDIVFQS